MKNKKNDLFLLILFCTFSFFCFVFCLYGYHIYYETNQIKEMIDCGFGFLLFLLFIFVLIFSYFEERNNDLYEDRFINLEIDNKRNKRNIASLMSNLTELYIDVHENKGE